MVHKFVMPKVSDYSNKLRVALERCHLEQKNYCFKFDGQIQVGTIDHLLLRNDFSAMPPYLIYLEVALVLFS